MVPLYDPALVSVSARPVRDLAQPATIGLVDMRLGGTTVAGSYAYEGDRVVTGWHHHDLHQLEYALLGVVEVETESARYLLPPRQAVWIPAGLEHETTIDAKVSTISVFFDPTLMSRPGTRARILAVDSLLREMLLRAVRWPIDRRHDDAVAACYFRVLADLVTECLDDEAPLSLPNSGHPVVAAAMQYTRSHLATTTADDVSRAVHVSSRTLRRLFRTEVGLSWRAYLQQARLLRAMSLLVTTSDTVLHIATAVGFDSVTSFTRAFVLRCGETPSSYRQRIIQRP